MYRTEVLSMISGIIQSLNTFLEIGTLLVIVHNAEVTGKRPTTYNRNRGRTEIVYKKF